MRRENTSYKAYESSKYPSEKSYYEQYSKGQNKQITQGSKVWWVLRLLYNHEMMRWFEAKNYCTAFSGTKLCRNAIIKQFNKS